MDTCPLNAVVEELPDGEGIRLGAGGDRLVVTSVSPVSMGDVLRDPAHDVAYSLVNRPGVRRFQR
jgi:hypothetical protein